VSLRQFFVVGRDKSAPDGFYFFGSDARHIKVALGFEIEGPLQGARQEPLHQNRDIRTPSLVPWRRIKPKRVFSEIDNTKGG
jgi:hypothetical protein